MEEYKKSIGRLAVAQLCQTMGFSNISSQALDTLEEVMRLLIEKIGERAKLIAETSNRTECNFLDTLVSLEVIQCTEDNIKAYLSVPQGFSFARNIRFPQKSIPQQKSNKQILYENNIPNFLPAFPPSHTYMFTPVPITRNMDAAMLRAIKIKEKREIEERLSSIIGGGMVTVPTTASSKNPYINLGLISKSEHLMQE